MIDRDALRDFYDDYYTALDDGRFEEWPAFFTEDCLYRVIPRENYEAGYTLSTMYGESRGMLIDRVMGNPDADVCAALLPPLSWSDPVRFAPRR
jgi:3-phenylpropionate/cinnamic acid dioxygenase small subunit